MTMNEEAGRWLGVERTPEEARAQAEALWTQSDTALTAECAECGTPEVWVSGEDGEPGEWVPQPDTASRELQAAAQAVVIEYDKTHLTHDVAYENVADAIDALRAKLRERAR
jgi:hypothetical protein